MPLSSRNMRASFSVEEAYDTLLEKIRNASGLLILTWRRRMKRNQHELPAYVNFSDSLSLRGLVCMLRIRFECSKLRSINSWPSVTENTLLSYLTSSWRRFLLSLDCKYVLSPLLPWFGSTLTLWHTREEWLHETLSIIEYAISMLCNHLPLVNIHRVLGTWLLFLPLNCALSLEWVNLTPLQMTRNWIQQSRNDKETRIQI